MRNILYNALKHAIYSVSQFQSAYTEYIMRISVVYTESRHRLVRIGCYSRAAFSSPCFSSASEYTPASLASSSVSFLPHSHEYPVSRFSS